MKHINPATLIKLRPYWREYRAQIKRQHRPLQSARGCGEETRAAQAEAVARVLIKLYNGAVAYQYHLSCSSWQLSIAFSVCYQYKSIIIYLVCRNLSSKRQKCADVAAAYDAFGPCLYRGRLIIDILCLSIIIMACVKNGKECMCGSVIWRRAETWA